MLRSTKILSASCLLPLLCIFDTSFAVVVPPTPSWSYDGGSFGEYFRRITATCPAWEQVIGFDGSPTNFGNRICDKILWKTNDGGISTFFNGKAKVTGLSAFQGGPNAGDASTNGFSFWDDGDTGIFSPGSATASNGQLGLYSNNVGALRIVPNGWNPFIGIGTNNPTAKLEVIGNIIASTPTAANHVVTKSYVDGNSWWAFGNSGMPPGSFIGTTDSTNIIFKRNGIQAGYLGDAPDYNTSWGVHALNSATTGIVNTAIGYAALSQNSSGYGNTALGVNSLWKNTSGGSNVAVGLGALYENLSWNENVAIGQSALISNTMGYGNVALGKSALWFNTTGYGNTANGTWALIKNTSGIWNTANGISALRDNETGNYNVGIGQNAGNNLVTWNFNTFLWSNTNTTLAGIINATAVGANVILSQSNTVILGNSANVGIGTSTPNAKLEIAGQIKITGGAPGVGKVLTSDASGLASWSTVAGGMGGFDREMDYNLWEDSYGALSTSRGRAIDTCDNDTANPYTCTPSDNRSCIDIQSVSSWFGASFEGRSITCQQARIPYKIIPPPTIRTCTATITAENGRTPVTRLSRTISFLETEIPDINAYGNYSSHNPLDVYLFQESCRGDTYGAGYGFRVGATRLSPSVSVTSTGRRLAGGCPLMTITATPYTCR